MKRSIFIKTVEIIGIIFCVPEIAPVIWSLLSYVFVNTHVGLVFGMILCVASAILQMKEKKYKRKKIEMDEKRTKKALDEAYQTGFDAGFKEHKRQSLFCQKIE